MSFLSAYPEWALRTQATRAALISKGSWCSEEADQAEELFQIACDGPHKVSPTRDPVPLDGPGLGNGGKIHHCIMESTLTFLGRCPANWKAL